MSENDASKSRILVVDDEESMRHMLQTVLGREGYEVKTAADAQAALEALGSDPVDVVLTDVRMPGAMDGLGLVEKLASDSTGTAVIVMSAYGSRELAFEAVRKGAYTYISKPFTADDILMTLGMALERQKLRAENRRLKRVFEQESAPGSLVGASDKMRQVYSTIRRIAEFKSTVLITGESGTGKELVARAIHVTSPRKDKPFVAVNCGAIPETLIESELFGHAKGAFTGAHAAKKGLVEEASGGTLFLDEIGELPAAMQVKLLRLLQESEVRRVGETRSQKVDVRIIAATARDLTAEVAAGRFREDLFYRLNVLPIHLPPLRERKEDIPLLVEHFVKKLAERSGGKPKHPSPDAMRALTEYDWTGNVRELENGLERATVLAAGDVIEVSDLPDKVRAPARVAPSSGGADPVSALLGNDLSIKKASVVLERELIRRALAKTKGNRTQAAELLEISARALLYKIRDYGLD